MSFIINYTGQESEPESPQIDDLIKRLQKENPNLRITSQSKSLFEGFFNKIVEVKRTERPFGTEKQRKTIDYRTLRENLYKAVKNSKCAFEVVYVSEDLDAAHDILMKSVQKSLEKLR